MRRTIPSWTNDATSVAVGPEHVRPSRSTARARRRGCGARAAATLRPAHGSWNVSVWLTTPVDTVTWACACPTPSCGRIAVPMRKPSVAKASRAWSTRRIVGRSPTKRVQTSRSGGPTRRGRRCRRRRRCGSPSRPAGPRACRRRGPATGGGGVGVADEVGLVGAQQHERARAQAVALADRHACCWRTRDRRACGRPRSTSGVSGEAPRAKTVCTVLTRLPSWPASPATIDWAEQLTAEDHPVAGVDVAGPVAVGARRAPA